MAPFNPTATSGIGFSLEHYVQASLVASLLLRTPIPFGTGMLIDELAFQAKHKANTDDVIVKFVGTPKHLVQSKKGFEINANAVFDETVEFMWKDFNGTGFDKQNDKFIIATDMLSKADSAHGLLVLEWARFSSDEKDFLTKIRSNKEKHAKYRYFQSAIQKANGATVTDRSIWEFLRTIHIKAYDYLQDGSKDREVLKWFLKPYVNEGTTPELALLSLLQHVRTYNQHGATINISNTGNEMKDVFNLSGSPIIGNELSELTKKSSSLIQHTIQNDVDGFHVERNEYITGLSLTLAEKRIVIVSGEGGAGKSGLVKEYLEKLCATEGSYLAFKADQLDHSSLAAAMASIGVSSDFETLLSQWQLLPRLIVYIDSFEKLHESGNKEAFLELLGKLKKANADIRIIATCRSFAVETLRAKYRIAKEEIGLVELKPLTAEQLQGIALSRPALRGIISNQKLQKLLALPFYLNIASQVIDSISNEDNLNEAEFKKALWELAIEKKGHGSTGHGKKRAHAFSTVVLQRAKEKLPYVPPGTGEDLATISELETDGLLIKHPHLDAYTPAHDIFEDMVVVHFLYQLFHAKASCEDFLRSIDSSPVFRRALRQWVQDLILQYPAEAGAFLTETFQLYDINPSIVDEMIIGILGSSEAYNLIQQNLDVFLKDKLKLFFQAFRLLKVAYTEPYHGEHPERKITARGHGWTALLRILDENLEGHKRLNLVLDDLLYHWTQQFSEDEALPEEGGIVAKLCLQLLEASKGSYRFRDQKSILEMLFFVAPFAEEAISKLIRDAMDAKKAKATIPGFTIGFHGDFLEMLLVDTFRCVKIYKLFPELITEVARMEWYRSGPAVDEYDHNYLESSFGLVEYPYKYFSASAYQTPFRYLFRYHPRAALDFLIELCNRSTGYYLGSHYAKTVPKLKITLHGGQETVLYGNADLWGTYRGMGASPYLLQSALMAFEDYLLGEAERDGIPETLFGHAIANSNSVLLAGPLSSVAMAYPLIFKEKVFAILATREIFAWDLSRYAQEFGTLHTTIGNDRFFTEERHVSNKLRHRTTNLENLMSKLQFYYPQVAAALLDGFKADVHKDDNPWQLALARMDMRNTTPEIKEEENIIVFNPNPLPGNLQEYVDEGAEERKHDSSTVAIYLWSEKAFKQEKDVVATYETWKEHYTSLQAVDLSKGMGFLDPSQKMAAVGIKFFAGQMSSDERAYCASSILQYVEQAMPQLKQGHVHGVFDVMSNGILEILPVLLGPAFSQTVSHAALKVQISDFLLLLPGDPLKLLVQGIRLHGWQADAEFSHECFQLLLKASKRHRLHSDIQRLGNLTPEGTIQQVDLLLSAIKTKGDIEPTDISLNADSAHKVLLALQSVPYGTLNGPYQPYLLKILLGIGELDNPEDHEHSGFMEGFQYLIAHYLINNLDQGSASILFSLLGLDRKHFKFTMDTLEKLVWVGHDNDYPSQFWGHMDLLARHVFDGSPLVGFVNVLLLRPLKHVKWANKIKANGPFQKWHELLVSVYAADKHLSGPVFKLLGGAGSTYQPACLKWMMGSLPDRKTIEGALELPGDIAYLSELVNQLYTDHMHHIRLNKDQMDYLIMLLNVLIDKGSTSAFRIRDEII